MAPTAPPPLVAVPVFGRLDALRAALTSLDAFTAPEVELLVIDDRGPQAPDHAMLAELLGGSGRTWQLVRNDRNLGFVGSANRAADAADGRDLVLVNSDVTVFAGWLDGLAAAMAGDDVASATAIGDDASILSLPLAGRSPQVLAAALRDLPDAALEIPVAVGHCMYLRAAALAQVGTFDPAFSPGYGEEVDWSWRARRLGWRHVAALRTFVTHAAGSSFGPGTARDRLRRRGELRLLARYPVRTVRLRTSLRSSANPVAARLAELDALVAREPSP